MVQSGKHITSLLYILVLVTVGAMGIINDRSESFPMNQAVFHSQFCTGQSMMEWTPPKRQLCDTGVYINRDDAHALEYLPTIGPKRALAIVAFRRKHGPFKKITDLQKVKGIGPLTVKGIQPWIEDLADDDTADDACNTSIDSNNGL